MHLDEGTIQMKDFQESVNIFREGNTCHSIRLLANQPSIIESSCPVQKNYENNQRAGENYGHFDFDHKL